MAIAEPVAASRPHFTLVAVTSRDGFITGPDGEPPRLWASPEEQVRFAETVSALDWSFLGRVTHDLAWRPDRRRVVFSRSCHTPLWRHPRRLWVDPDKVPLATILETLRPIHPPEHCGILGGVGVHDWFAARRLIDAADLTIEPFAFGRGRPLFEHLASRDPRAALHALGLVQRDVVTLNAAGTRLYRFTRERP